MSNLLLNIRFWYWHFQISRDRPYGSFGRNRWRWENGERFPWFEIHEARLP